MARQLSALAVALVLGVFASIPTDVHSIGVCNGMVGDTNTLPSRADVVQFYKTLGIGAMRIYGPDHDTLQALDGTGIDLIIDISNEQLAALASDPAAASNWVRDNVQAYYPGVSIKYIAVGNEVVGDDTQNIVPAMRNLNDALTKAGITGVKVSTAVKMDVLSTSSPPSTGAFKDAYMTDVAKQLKDSGAPLLANVYPYFAKKGNSDIDLNYALFQPSSTTVTDDNGLTYTNLFDAMVDAMVAAMEKVDASGVPIVVSESGWPSAGGVAEATIPNAQAYNQNLINHVGNGTPKRPGPLETYIFAMFNENKKPVVEGDETERNFGLFKGPEKTPVYPIRFNN